jgi:hypothetical protein
MTGFASGTIGASPFTGVLTTVALTGDTSNIAAAAFCPTCQFNLGSTTVNIPGIGTAVVTDPTAILSSVTPIDPGDPGFPLLPYVAIIVVDHPPEISSNPGVGIGLLGSSDLLGYDLRSSIGPITATPGSIGHDLCCIIHTSFGDLIFASNVSPTDRGTFAATTIPEPSSFLLLIAGVVALTGNRLRRSPHRRLWPLPATDA